jgi:hypothetical protein
MRLSDHADIEHDLSASSKGAPPPKQIGGAWPTDHVRTRRKRTNDLASAFDCTRRPLRPSTNGHQGRMMNRLDRRSFVG